MVIMALIVVICRTKGEECCDPHPQGRFLFFLKFLKLYIGD